MAWDEQGKWTYTVDGGVATVTSGPSTGDISVPAAFAGVPVGAIGPSAFARCTALTSIAFPPTVTSIGDSAFYGCIALTNAPLPDALAALGSRAFQGCSSLAAIDLPDALAAIPPYAFASCSALASLSFGDHVTSIGNYAFNQCRALPSLSSPSPLSPRSPLSPPQVAKSSSRQVRFPSAQSVGKPQFPFANAHCRD